MFVAPFNSPQGGTCLAFGGCCCSFEIIKLFHHQIAKSSHHQIGFNSSSYNPLASMP
jgi:hypothetical protein